MDIVVKSNYHVWAAWFGSESAWSVIQSVRYMLCQDFLYVSRIFQGGGGVAAVIPRKSVRLSPPVGMKVFFFLTLA